MIASDVIGYPGGGSGFSEPTTWAWTFVAPADQPSSGMRTALATRCFRGGTRAKAVIRYTSEDRGASNRTLGRHEYTLGNEQGQDAEEVAQVRRTLGADIALE